MPDLTISSSATDMTTFTVKVDGEALPRSYSIVSIDIVIEINRIPCATLVVHDGDAAKQDFEVSSDALLVPGRTLEIEGGYRSDENLLFKGVIIGQRIKVKRRGDSILQIQARDPVFRMALGRKSRYYTEMSDSDMFEQIIGQYSGLTPQVASTATHYPEIVQYQVSDWDFLVARAEKAGLYCLPDNGTLRIEEPDPQQPAALELNYGGNVFGLDLQLDARTQYGKVTASAWDQTEQDVLSAEVEDVASPSQGNIAGPELAGVGALERFEMRHSGSLPQEELDGWAQAGMIKSRFARIRGTVRVQGTQAVKPGGLVDLGGMGERFNGKAFVSGVRHVLGAGDWETALQIGLPALWHHENFNISAPSAAGLNPAINGLHTGVVTQLQDDPEGEERILVRLPLISTEDTGVWSRVATLDAGENRGTFFRPEIGDEVLVGFINDDPHEAVVLGMLHSSSKPAPLAASDDNHHKTLVTRSGMKVLFDDETPSLSIETPNGNKVVINDGEGSILVSDESGNTVTLNSQGIALESPGDIVLKAAGDVSIEGTNVNNKAGAALTVEGSAGATLKSAGTTEVKGSLVQIN